MKTELIKLLATFVLIPVALASYASDIDPAQDRLENVRTQIVQYIEEPDLSGTNIEEVQATLHFFINKESELVVVYVDSDDQFVDRFLKERLNYKEISDNLLRGAYAMKITIKNGSI